MKSAALRVALLAGIGLVAVTLPAAAAPAVQGVAASTETRTADPLMQVAQANATRAASEMRGGDYKAKKPKKKKKKGKKGKKG